jgi:hypothetical protein
MEALMSSTWYHYDGLGSVRALTDDTGTVTDTAVYQAFGTQVASTGSTVNTHRWVGKLGTHSDPPPRYVDGGTLGEWDRGSAGRRGQGGGI